MRISTLHWQSETPIVLYCEWRATTAARLPEGRSLTMMPLCRCHRQSNTVHSVTPSLLPLRYYHEHKSHSAIFLPAEFCRSAISNHPQCEWPVVFLFEVCSLWVLCGCFVRRNICLRGRHTQPGSPGSQRAAGSATGKGDSRSLRGQQDLPGNSARLQPLRARSVHRRRARLLDGVSGWRWILERHRSVSSSRGV